MQFLFAFIVYLSESIRIYKTFRVYKLKPLHTRLVYHPLQSYIREASLFLDFDTNPTFS